MIRKLLVLVAILAFPFLTATAASAADPQYPPVGHVEVDSADPGDTSPAEVTKAEVADPGAAPLARTGSETGPLLLVGGVLVAGGALAVGASILAGRRGTATTPA